MIIWPSSPGTNTGSISFWRQLVLQSSLDHNLKHNHLKTAITAQTLPLAAAHVIHSVGSRQKPHGPPNLTSLFIITFAQLLITV